MKMVRNASTQRKRAAFSQKKTIKPWIKGFVVVICLGIVVFIGKIILERTIFYNPLLGTWRGQTAMGIREVVFERDSMTSFGTKTPVKYDIKEKEVIVMDTSLQLGNAYVLIDENTISSKMGNVKTTFKRVK